MNKILIIFFSLSMLSTLQAADLYHRVGLEQAVMTGNLELATAHLTAGANPNDARMGVGRPLLFDAVTSKDPHLKLARLLLKHEADINIGDNVGNTPLHQAMEHGRLDAVELLLEAKADINKTNNLGSTPFMSECQGRYHNPLITARSKAPYLALLLQQPSLNLHVRDSINKQTAFVSLVQQHNLDVSLLPIIANMLEHGANPNDSFFMAGGGKEQTIYSLYSVWAIVHDGDRRSILKSVLNILDAYRNSAKNIRSDILAATSLCSDTVALVAGYVGILPNKEALDAVRAKFADIAPAQENAFSTTG